jgi:dihydroflavonol-4-reductase
MSVVALTGATGFLGAHIVAALGPGHTVRAISRRGHAVGGAAGVAADCTDRASISRALAGADLLIHAAGKVSHHPDDAAALWDAHVVATRETLAAAREAGVRRVVYLSTSGTCAVGRDAGVPKSEDAVDVLPLIQEWPYYRSKRFAEELALAAHAPGFEVICLNPSLLLGPGDEPLGASTRPVRVFLDDGVPFPPGGTIAFVDVRDVAAACVRALHHGPGGQRILLNGANLRFAAFYERLARISGKRGPIAAVPDTARRVLRWLPGLGKDSEIGIGGAKLSRDELILASHHWDVDDTRARGALGWSPRDPTRTLEDTIFDLQDRRAAAAARWA